MVSKVAEKIVAAPAPPDQYCRMISETVVREIPIS